MRERPSRRLPLTAEKTKPRANATVLVSLRASAASPPIARSASQADARAVHECDVTSHLCQVPKSILFTHINRFGKRALELQEGRSVRRAPSKMRASSSSSSVRTTAGSSSITTNYRVVGGPRASLGGPRRGRASKRVELSDAPPPLMMTMRRRLVTTTAWTTHRVGGVCLHRDGERCERWTAVSATRAWTAHATGDATKVRARFFCEWFLFLLLHVTTRR